MNDLIVITGPTASGKTKLAVRLASQMKAEIISADSRQVYRNMNIGTGKDLEEYGIKNEKIPVHLIDCYEAGERRNMADYKRSFNVIHHELSTTNRHAILCGGSGMYIEAVLKNFEVSNEPFKPATSISHKLYIINPSRSLRRQRIAHRLEVRLKEGLIDEVERLLQMGVEADTLIYYGLEYKYVTLYLQKYYSYDEMKEKLLIAIQQFAKRQMTWFRGMERRGFNPCWIDGDQTVEEQLRLINQTL